MSAVSPPIQAVIDLFEGPLSGVRFGDVDGAALRRLAEEAEAARGVLEAQQATLNALRQAMTERQEQLLAQAQRALAHARIYAENDESLTAQLATIHLPRAPKRPKAEATAEGNSAAATAPAVSVKSEGSTRRVDVEASPNLEDAESNDASTPAASRRGKRRQATRVLTPDDGAMESSA
ncbi:MAG TPA: hypothetical protein VIM73_20855 [Polyangiaceae bacterium]